MAPMRTPANLVATLCETRTRPGPLPPPLDRGEILSELSRGVFVSTGAGYPGYMIGPTLRICGSLTAPCPRAPPPPPSSRIRIRIRNPMRGGPGPRRKVTSYTNCRKSSKHLAGPCLVSHMQHPPINWELRPPDFFCDDFLDSKNAPL